MGQQSDAAMRVQFGVFEADLKTGELRRSGVRVRLQSQPFKLLAALLSRPGEIVTREELQQLLWGTDTTVDFDHSLGIAVNKLREALGDHAENPRFVETLAKRGYRFIAPVKTFDNQSLPPQEGSRAQEETATRKTGASPAWLWVAGALALLSVTLGLALLLRAPSHTPFRVVQVT